MTNQAARIRERQRVAATLPDVEEWIRAGGKVERIVDPPRREMTMHSPRRERRGK